LFLKVSVLACNIHKALFLPIIILFITFTFSIGALELKPKVNEAASPPIWFWATFVL